ncbi:hypothetical protein HQ447_19735 [bacterium]|nr:hypothetical protein [bacterium]
MARIQQKSSGIRSKRQRTHAAELDQAASDSLTRHGQPPLRWGEYLPRHSRKPAASTEKPVEEVDG